ncbi:aldo/keto reductase [Oceanispirochaeta sp.]|jgi:aryl-alcohol dehydrogenase-like predicted oxidoreductase|uniref:aldo/keto reductase n=1 Tax=Oceanispirochaeta sp. TaxID=2035350 RepID=UPI0026360B6A|nr:aldo/keto reductase [Oceanispirochaeta sp.]MDA3956929.1 aldo/keto reductase [Oceanispirochaeta sp.]
MNFNYLGNTGIQVSSLCFGTMSFGGDADEETSLEMYKLCRNKGINFFDCANVYQKGLSEEILGKCIKGHRNEIVLTSKVNGPMSDNINDKGNSRRNLRLSLEASLKRLGTDYLDFYFLHRFDDNTVLEETLETMDQFVREGKILYPAVSNFAAWQVMKAQGVSMARGLSSIQCIQPMYNLLKRQAEVELLPMAQSESMGVICYSPMAGGLLSGKYRTKENTGRFSSNKAYQSRYRAPSNPKIVENYMQLAEELGYHPVSLDIAWTGGHPAVTAPIIGARNSFQLETALGAADINMTDELRQRISELSPTPPPATDRSEV